MRYLFLASCCVVLIGAASERLFVYTIDASLEDTKIKSTSSLSVDYLDSHLKSSSMIYDTNKSVLNLYKDVEYLNLDFALAAKEAKAEFKKKEVSFSPFFFTQFQSKIWLSGENIKISKDKVEIKNSYLSSCSSECADWRLFFKKGVLDRKRHWLTLYNINFYAGNTPIFYFPYLSFSTQKKRKSGFLRPKFAISNQEGFVYIQPYYYAEVNWWDFEVDPQIRTKRGKGLYYTFRFVDSNSSYGEFRSGFFKENKSYYQKYNLKNSSHYGAEFFYKRLGLFSKSSDGVYADIKSYNDIDYFTLQKNSDEGSVPLTISRLNYIYEKERDFFGLYVKYFKDNKKVNNDDTLQILPALQYHRYYKTILSNLSYKIDANAINYYRKKGLSAIEYSIEAPVMFQYSFFDGLLGFLASENLNAKYVDYSNQNPYKKNYYIYRNSHKIELFSDLVKKYQNNVHYLNLNLTLDIPSFKRDGGDKASFIDIEKNSKRAVFSIKNYLFRKNKEIFYHRLTQEINYDLDYKARDLENEFGFKYNDIEFNMDIFYSHQHHNISAIKSVLDIDSKDYSLYVSHFYKNSSFSDDSNFLVADFRRNLSKQNQLFATIEYNFINSSTKSWSFGYKMDKKCWGYEISYKKDLIPFLTTDGSRFNENRTIYFRIELYPLGGFSKSFRSRQSQRIF